MSDGKLIGRSPILGAKSAGAGGSGAFSGAKMFAAASGGLTQLASSGYAWDGTSYDTDSYITLYGADPAGAFDPLTIVFHVPTDGIYRVSGILWPVGAAGATGGVIRWGGNELTGDSDMDKTICYAAGIHDTAAFTTYAPSVFTWDGRVTDVDDGRIVGLWTSLAMGGITSDKIAQGSWVAIERLLELSDVGGGGGG